MSEPVERSIAFAGTGNPHKTYCGVQWMSVEKILFAYRQELAKTIEALKSEHNSPAALRSAESIKKDLRRRVAIAHLIEMIDK